MDRIMNRAIVLITGLASIGGFINWFIFAINNADVSPSILFRHWSFIVFVLSVALFVGFRLYSWKKTMDNVEDIIFEIVIYRKMTPVNAIARRLAINNDEAYAIIQNMILTGKILGYIKDNIYYSHSPKTPICPLCDKEIDDNLHLIVCPFCRKPYHKKHLMDYLKKKEERCPNCDRVLTIADLYNE